MWGDTLEDEIRTHNTLFLAKLKETNTTIKLVVVFSLLFMNVFFRTLSFSLFVILSAFILTLLLRVSIKDTISKLKFPFIFGLLIFFLQSMFLRNGEVITKILGIEIYSEGLLKGAKIFLTLVGSTWYLILVFLTSTVDETLSSLKKLGIPKIIIDISLMMYRYSILLREEAIKVFLAQKSRLGYTNLKNSVRSLGQLWGIILVNSLIRAIKVNEAMKSRNFSGKLFFDFTPKPNKKELIGAFSFILIFFLTGILLKLTIGA